MKGKTLFISTFLILAILMSSCFRRAKEERAEKRAEKIMEKIMEKAGAEDADVDFDKQKFSLTTDEGTLTMEASEEAWPDEIPASVPKFDFGKSGGVMKQDMPEVKSWIMNFEDVPEDAYEKYKAKLSNTGYECYTMESDNLKRITGDKDGIMVILRFFDNECVLSVAQKKEES